MPNLDELLKKDHVRNHPLFKQRQERIAMQRRNRKAQALDFVDEDEDNLTDMFSSNEDEEEENPSLPNLIRSAVRATENVLCQFNFPLYPKVSYNNTKNIKYASHDPDLVVEGSVLLNCQIKTLNGLTRLATISVPIDRSRVIPPAIIELNNRLYTISQSSVDQMVERGTSYETEELRDMYDPPLIGDERVMAVEMKYDVGYMPRDSGDVFDTTKRGRMSDLHGAYKVVTDAMHEASESGNDTFPRQWSYLAETYILPVVDSASPDVWMNQLINDGFCISPYGVNRGRPTTTASKKTAGPPGKFEGVPDEYLELAESLYGETADDEAGSVSEEGVWLGLYEAEKALIFEDEQGFVDIEVFASLAEAQEGFRLAMAEIDDTRAEVIRNIKAYWFVIEEDQAIALFAEDDLDAAENVAFAKGADIQHSTLEEIKTTAESSGLDIMLDIQDSAYSHEIEMYLLDVSVPKKWSRRAQIEDLEVDEPEEEDGFISDARGGGYNASLATEFLGEFPTEEEAEEAIREAGGGTYFPNVWYIDDHGGNRLIEDFWADDLSRNAQIEDLEVDEPEEYEIESEVGEVNELAETNDWVEEAHRHLDRFNVNQEEVGPADRLVAEMYEGLLCIRDETNEVCGEPEKVIASLEGLEDEAELDTVWGKLNSFQTEDEVNEDLYSEMKPEARKKRGWIEQTVLDLGKDAVINEGVIDPDSPYVFIAVVNAPTGEAAVGIKNTDYESDEPSETGFMSDLQETLVEWLKENKPDLVADAMEYGGEDGGPINEADEEAYEQFGRYFSEGITWDYEVMTGEEADTLFAAHADLAGFIDDTTDDWDVEAKKAQLDMPEGEREAKKAQFEDEDSAAYEYLERRWDYLEQKGWAPSVGKDVYIKRNLVYVKENIEDNPDYLEEAMLKQDIRETKMSQLDVPEDETLDSMDAEPRMYPETKTPMESGDKVKFNGADDTIRGKIVEVDPEDDYLIIESKGVRYQVHCEDISATPSTFQKMWK